MRLARVRLCNFRCFGPAPTTIELDDLTALLGANGSGKTAVLEALARLFGATQQARTLIPDDFHVDPSQRRDALPERSLWIEAEFEFPSLGDAAPEHEGTRTTPEERGAAGERTVNGRPREHPGHPATPPMFERMAVSRPGGPLFCRIRLTGVWSRSAIAEGTVESRLEWLQSADEEPTDEHRSAVSVRDRDRVRVYYVPAARDAARHLAAGASGMLRQVLSAVEWDEGIRKTVETTGESLRRAFAAQPAVERLNGAYELHWEALYDEWLYRKPSLHLAARRIEDTVRSAQIVFNPTHGHADHALDRLSDGQQSLFYFAFMATLFDIQREVLYREHQSEPPAQGATEAQTPTGTTGASDGTEEGDVVGGEGPSTAPLGSPACGFSYDELQPPVLTIFAVEEPENHLAPHYLGRIVARLESLVESGCAQVVLASHAPAVLGRIDPRTVRYVRHDASSHLSTVQRLVLPDAQTEADKYVREAVRAFPELYFARAVVLCEGDSEQFLIPRFARLVGRDLDLSFVSVVPLGGRHVNHFWRLLRSLGVPFVTLLDLDRERETGGWERVHYVIDQLLMILPATDADALRAGPPGFDDALVDAAALQALKRRDLEEAGSTDLLAAWVHYLPRFNVFFSAPLDVDFLMLEAFPDVYQETALPGRPRSGQAAAITRVLGDGATGSTFTPEQRALFPWYGYLFLGRGKPSTHTAAWVRLDPAVAATRMPEPVRVLLESVRDRLLSAQAASAASASSCVATSREAALLRVPEVAPAVTIGALTPEAAVEEVLGALNSGQPAKINLLRVGDERDDAVGTAPALPA